MTYFPGMAAANAVMEILQQGDHIVASKQVWLIQ
jgi:O-acetylhomoserine/O-acetylserine sulfhydrylase-like pyridoxal-dependent enzyme